MTDWKPTASLDTIRRRADFLRRIRGFFEQRRLLEVDTPILSQYGVTDVHVENIRTETGDCLLTSPEYPMKRLLAAGLGDIFQLGHVFRRGEAGPRHNPEFTLLEWYRLGWDDHRLMDEVAELCRELADDPGLETRRLSYQAAFEAAGLPDPHRADDDRLRAAVDDRLGSDAHDWPRDTCLDALMALVVEPGLPPEALTFITHYPASQAALAQHERHGDVTLGRRFELYWRGMELANGYFELTDPDEQRRRFEADRERRRALGRFEAEADPRLISALAAGLPDCAGVALGVDRLLMLVLGKRHIAEVIPFDAHNA